MQVRTTIEAFVPYRVKNSERFCNIRVCLCSIHLGRLRGMKQSAKSEQLIEGIEWSSNPDQCREK
jgi:hypothetical protein